MLMPSHAKVVQPYRDIHPIFSRAGIEAQLDRMLQPQVTLRSGGYIIINQTEALVSIDVNSGRSTREHSIEDTALQTNLEAAEEVARQLRLRDLAGLVVIDFIDMEEKRNNRHVEKRLKDHLKNDRARIQVGRISHFGLLEMSRQRIRASVLESTMQTCPHCGGTGHIRSQSSVGLHVLRGIEEFLLKSTTHDIIVHTQADTALYLLNHKRASIVDYENRFGVSILIGADGEVGGQPFVIERGEAVENPVKIEQLIVFPIEEEEEDDIPVVEDEEEEAEERSAAAQAAPAQARSDDQGGKKKKRRRRRRGSRPGAPDGAHPASPSAFAGDEALSEDDADEDSDDEDGEGDGMAAVAAPDIASTAEADNKKRRRRGKRGGRRGREDETAEASSETDDDADEADAATGPEAEAEAPVAMPRRSRRGKAAQAETLTQASPQADVPATATEPVEPAPATETAVATTPANAPAAADDEQTAEEKPRRSNRGDAALSSSTPAVVTSSSNEGTEEDAKPKKGGWWQKRGFL
jgi:ribonuclease E